MYSRKLLAALAATTLALTFSACGDDEEEPAATPSDTPAVTAEEPDAMEDTETDTGSVLPTEEEGQELLDAAIENCKQQATSAPNLDDETKAEIEELCESAGTGDMEQAQEAGREVCRKIVEANVPEGDAREQGLATCDSVGGG
jgi:hypothetical protein